ncbi:MAG: peptidase M28, partial [Spirosomataceae bacterium]
MKKYLLLIPVVLLFATTSNAQKIVNRDVKIEQLVNEVSGDSLKAYVEKLVTFGTRSTLSTDENPNRGIAASRRWV